MLVIIHKDALTMEVRGISSRALDGRSVSPVLRPHWGLIHFRAMFDSPHLFSKNKDTHKGCPNFLVEVRGIEPLSEKATAKLSPSAVCVLTFPLPGAHRRAQGFSSFIMWPCGKA